VFVADRAAKYRFVATITDCLQRVRRSFGRLVKLGSFPMSIACEVRDQDVLARLEKHEEEQAQVAVVDQLRPPPWSLGVA
jgi:hypothetical protein